MPEMFVAEKQSSSKLILTLESTCDETAAAIIADDLSVRASVVASQSDLHKKYSGVVPEIAARAHVERILPVIAEVLRAADCQPPELAAVAVAHTPGLSGSLLIGLTAAKSLALGWQKPLIAINHLHAHIYACRMAAQKDVFPCVGLVVSGGHSHLYNCQNPLDFQYLGGTIDDAAGEAFDKVASMLGLGYPGGPAISAAARSGNPAAYSFPRSMIHDKSRLDFSFSGLKTAVRYAIAGPGRQDFSKLNLDPQTVANVAASFQQAVVDCLVAKSCQALLTTGHPILCVGGGVAANRLLRQELSQAIQSLGAEIHFAPIELCTDNAIMGAIAFEHLRAGNFDELNVDIVPGLVRSI